MTEIILNKVENITREDIILLIEGFKETEAKKFVPSIFTEPIYKFVDSKILGVFKDVHTVKMEATLYLTQVMRTLDLNGHLTEKVEDSEKGYVILEKGIDMVRGSLPLYFVNELVYE